MSSYLLWLLKLAKNLILHAKERAAVVTAAVRRLSVTATATASFLTITTTSYNGLARSSNKSIRLYNNWGSTIAVTTAHL
jgi:hypothetical protein